MEADVRCHLPSAICPFKNKYYGMDKVALAYTCDRRNDKSANSDAPAKFQLIACNSRRAQCASCRAVMCRAVMKLKRRNRNDRSISDSVVCLADATPPQERVAGEERQLCENG